MSEQSIHIDKALLLRIAADDHNAFEQLFQRYADKMHAAIFNYTKSRFIAEELTQEVFIRLWKHRVSLVKVEDPAAYLYRMVFNLINTYLRKAANEQRILANANLWATSADEGTRQKLAANEMERIIEEGIEKLPPQKKTIYRMSQEQGMNYKEIGEVLQISPNTVKNHLAEAMKQMRVHLRNYAVELCIIVLQSIRP